MQDAKELFLGILRHGPVGLSDYLSELESGVRKTPTLRSLNRESKAAANILRQISLRPTQWHPPMVVKIDREDCDEFVLNPEHPDVRSEIDSAMLRDWLLLIKRYGSGALDSLPDPQAQPSSLNVQQCSPNQDPEQYVETDPMFLLYAKLRDLVAIVMRATFAGSTEEVFTIEFVDLVCRLPGSHELTAREVVAYHMKLKSIRVHERCPQGNVYALRPGRMKKRWESFPAVDIVRGEAILAELYPDPKQYDAELARLASLVAERVPIVAEGECPFRVAPVHEVATDESVSADASTASETRLVVTTAVLLSDDELEVELRLLRERTSLLQSIASLRRQVKEAAHAVQLAVSAEESASAERDRLKVLYDQACADYEACVRARANEEQLFVDANSLLADAERKVV